MSKLYILIQRILISLMSVASARAFIHHYKAAAQAQHSRKCQLLVDVSVIINEDAHTGIQRVVRALLQQLMECPPENYQVVPIFATRKDAYRYAPSFLNPSTEQSDIGKCGAVVFVQPGDVFLGLDLSAHLLPRHHAELIHWKRYGVSLYFVVYDLLPVQNPDWFSAKTSKNIKRWLRTIAIFADGLICISDVVKNDVTTWMTAHYGLNGGAPLVKTISLGADIAASVPSRGLPPNVKQLLEELSAKPSVMMVGTLEPRKGHAQVIAAFEELWQKCCDINLVIVGKAGWKTIALQQRLSTHPKRNKSLYWLDHVSDEMLELLYNVVVGVIVASEAEGFGLSLVEAAYYNKPVLARDIPIFREIGGEWITYFTPGNSKLIAKDIDSWLNRIAKGQIIASQMPPLTWEDSARQLLVQMNLPD